MVTNTSDYHVIYAKRVNFQAKSNKNILIATMKSNQDKYSALYAESEDTKKNNNKKLTCSKTEVKALKS